MVCLVMILNYFVCAFVRYGAEKSEWTAVSCDADVYIETRLQVCHQSTEVGYTIAD